MNVKDIKKIACVGGGLIGSSWATNFIMKGYETVLYDLNDEAIALAKQRVLGNLAFLQKKNLITAEAIEKALSLLSYTTSLEVALKGVQLVQESAPERYEVKQALLGEIDKYVGSNVLYASSTSGLLISEISRYSKYQARCIGAHPYNPPHLIPLVELVGDNVKSAEALKVAKEFYTLLGKEPIILKKEAPGYVANRIQAAVQREICEIAMRDIATVEDIDKAITFGPGLRWAIIGPSLIRQLGGGKEGLKGMIKLLGKTNTIWLEDMAKWTEYPEEWGDIAQAGVDEEMANRPAEIGNTTETLKEYRDDMLIEILKLHKKI